MRPRRDRRAALDGADYVVTSFQVGGYKPSTVVDFEVPKRYGLRQTIADTLGIGGIMRGLRTIPVLLDVCRDLEELSPGRAAAQLRQPDGDAVLGGRRGVADPDRRALPLGPAHGAASWPRTSGVRLELDYHVAGINHVAFFLRLEHEGEDMYPRAARGRRRPTGTASATS